MGERNIRTDLMERYDYQSATTIYVGRAPVGSTETGLGWVITRYDLSSSANAKGEVADDVSWTNRASGTYT